MTKAKVFRADLYGLREGKYRALWESDVSTTEWEEVAPQTPFYLFAKRDEDTAAEYEKSWKITEVMPTNVLGFQTHRDKFAIDFDEEIVRQRVQQMRNPHLSDDELRAGNKLKDNRDWKLSEARAEVSRDKDWERFLVRCLYRPFDHRYCYFSEVTMDYPRRELIDHVFEKENLCLLVPRQIGTLNWHHTFAAKQVAESCAISTKTKEQNYVFSLYLYPTNSLFDTGVRRPNLSPEFTAAFAEKVGLEFIGDGKGNLTSTFGPEDVFHYIYAVFHAPSYRERYAEFLKIDFPRVPLTSNLGLFRTLTAHGETLVALHLMERVGSPISSYPVDGDNTVDKVSFSENEDGKTGRVYLNQTQYFDGVPLTVWNFHVGGYQVCQKWLKDRKGRTLSYDDLRHYGFIVSALFETIGVMGELDTAIEAAGGWPLA